MVDEKPVNSYCIGKFRRCLNSSNLVINRGSQCPAGVRGDDSDGRYSIACAAPIRRASSCFSGTTGTAPKPLRRVGGAPGEGICTAAISVDMNLRTGRKLSLQQGLRQRGFDECLDGAF